MRLARPAGSDGLSKPRGGSATRLRVLLLRGGTIAALRREGSRRAAFERRDAPPPGPDDHGGLLEQARPSLREEVGRRRAGHGDLAASMGANPRLRERVLEEVDARTLFACRVTSARRGAACSSSPASPRVSDSPACISGRGTATSGNRSAWIELLLQGLRVEVPPRRFLSGVGVTRASFWARESALICRSTCRARRHVLTRRDQTSFTGRRERVYFDAVPA